jgi:hypothetical protein
LTGFLGEKVQTPLPTHADSQKPKVNGVIGGEIQKQKEANKAYEEESDPMLIGLCVQDWAYCKPDDELPLEEARVQVQEKADTDPSENMDSVPGPGAVKAPTVDLEAPSLGYGTRSPKR